MGRHPIEGQVFLLAAAKASVTPERLSALLERADRELTPRRERYRREYECVHADETRLAFLVEEGHWARLGADLGLEDRETAALRRAHEEQVRRIGRRDDREAEFEAALEIREPVVLAAE